MKLIIKVMLWLGDYNNIQLIYQFYRIVFKWLINQIIIAYCSRAGNTCNLNTLLEVRG